MDDIKNKFIADAIDILQKLEEQLLKLEKSPRNTELVQEIFRALHTLKGTSGMYGFKSIEKIMHLIENVFDMIRDDVLNVNETIMELSFRVVDASTKVLKKKGSKISKQLTSIISKLEEEISLLIKAVPESTQKSHEIAKKYKTDSLSQTFYIKLEEPDKDYNIDFDFHEIYEELSEYGKVITRKNKSFTDEKANWDIFVITLYEEKVIEAVFLFMNDLAEINKLAKINLFESEAFSNHIKNKTVQKQQFDINELLAVSEIAKSEVAEKRQKESEEQKNESSKTVFLKVDAEKIDEQMNLLSELVTAKAELRLIAEKEGFKKIYKVTETIDKITARFRKNILKIRLIPVKTLYNRLQRLVRDISARLDKPVNFTSEGLDTELDINIIDSLEVPLTHIIRNSIDHGIENKEERIKKGKPETGIIGFRANHTASHIFIEIFDDGQGIDTNKIKEKAIKKGIISNDTALSDTQILELIFLPGFSTSKNLSEVSGRGVGMDVVKKSINQMRGEIEVKTEKNNGTTIIIKLPLTLSIIDTMLIKTGEQFFSIPLPAISYCTQIKHEQLKDSGNDQIILDGNLIPYISLREKFSICGENPEKEKVVVINNGNQEIGLIVDSVIGEHQAVLKPLAEYFIENEYFSGASILADGHLSIILDTNKLIDDNIHLNQ